MKDIALPQGVDAGTALRSRCQMTHDREGLRGVGSVRRRSTVGHAGKMWRPLLRDAESAGA
jgi:hypothetical protein